MNKERCRNTKAAGASVALMVLALMVLLAGAAPQPAMAAQAGHDNGVIMVLPFQINAPAAEQTKLYQDITEMLAQRLAGHGLRVIQPSSVQQILEQRGITTLDLNTVRNLVRQVGAKAAVYGSYNQTGSSFSIDARLVPAASNEQAIPIYVEQSSTANLSAAVNELASKAAGRLVNKGSSITQVEVRGTKVLDPDVVLLRINTKPGDSVDPATLDAEVRRIWDLGYFSDIQVNLEQHADGMHLVYTVKEKPRVERVSVEGNSEVSTSDITTVMGTRAGTVLNEKTLADDLQKIREIYRKDGYYLAAVTYDMTTTADGSSAGITVKIQEGNRLYIKQIKLEGVESLSKGDVLDQLALKERGWFSWITGTGVLREEMLERDVSAIAIYYMNNGFMDVTVAQPKVDYQDDGITITYVVHEGPRYKVGAVKFVGELLDSDDEMAKVTKMDELGKKSDYFNLSVMQDDAKALTDYYAHYGYAFANVVPQPRKAEGSGSVMDVVYSIEKKQKVYIRKVVVDGNMRTRDNVVLREMQLVDGDTFDGDKLAKSMRRLNNSGYFELAESELVPTNNPEEVDLKIKLKEAKTGSIMGGVGYSTFSNFGVSGQISEKNLWGKGYSVALQAMVSGRRTAYNLNFTNPRLYDSKVGMSFDLYNWKDDYWDYDRRTSGGNLRFGYPLGNYTYATVGYRLDYNHLTDFDEDASELYKQYDGYRWSSVLQGQISRNTFDKNKPDDATTASLKAEYAGRFMQGDDDFIKLIADLHGYKKLAENHMVHLGGRAAGLFKNGSDNVPVYERFWMGGINSVRGYSAKDIVPRDPKTDDRLGGDRMAYINAEYIWSVSKDLGINLVPFFDAGINVDTDQDWSWNDDLKKSAGMEVRWRSPIGDLRFAYGYPLDDGWNGKDLDGRFEFSMGNFF